MRREGVGESGVGAEDGERIGALVKNVGGQQALARHFGQARKVVCSVGACSVMLLLLLLLLFVRVRVGASGEMEVGRQPICRDGSGMATLSVSIARAYGGRGRSSQRGRGWRVSLRVGERTGRGWIFKDAACGGWARFLETTARSKRF